MPCALARDDPRAPRPKSIIVMSYRWQLQRYTVGVERQGWAVTARLS